MVPPVAQYTKHKTNNTTLMRIKNKIKFCSLACSFATGGAFVSKLRMECHEVQTESMALVGKTVDYVCVT